MTTQTRWGWLAAAVIFGFSPVMMTACGGTGDDGEGTSPTNEATADGERKVRDSESS